MSHLQSIQMNNPVWQAIENRSSTVQFDPDHALSDDVIATLVQLATRAPSAYNFQNWRFIAVRSPQAKERLRAVGFGQQKLVDASVAFIICGTLAAHTQLATVLQASVDAGELPAAVAQAWVAQAESAHRANPVVQRDEAIRSASLAAMTLMLAAQGLGLASCPMIGFDMAALAQAFGLGPQDVPAIVVTVGRARKGNPAQKLRKPVGEVLSLL